MSAGNCRDLWRVCLTVFDNNNNNKQTKTKLRSGGGGGGALFCVHKSTLRRSHSWVMKTLGWKSRGLGIECWYGQLKSYAPPPQCQEKMLVWAGWNLCPSPQRHSKGCGLCAHYKPCFSAPSPKLCQNCLCHWRGTLYFPFEWMKICIDIFILYSAFHPRPCMYTVKCGTIKYTEYREMKKQTGGGGEGGGTISIISRQKHLYNCSCGTRSVSLDLSKTLTGSIYFKSRWELLDSWLTLTSSSILLNTPAFLLFFASCMGCETKKHA